MHAPCFTSLTDEQCPSCYSVYSAIQRGEDPFPHPDFDNPVQESDNCTDPDFDNPVQESDNYTDPDLDYGVM